MTHSTSKHVKEFYNITADQKYYVNNVKIPDLFQLTATFLTVCVQRTKLTSFLISCHLKRKQKIMLGNMMSQNYDVTMHS